MLSRWMPDAVYSSIHHLPWQSLRQNYDAIIFDADNTLGPWQLKQLDQTSLTLLKHLSDRGFSIGVLSNSRMHGRKERIETQLKALNIPLMTSANKPGKSGYQRMMQALHSTAETTIMVGDQWITDVVGAKRLGLKTLMVKPFSLKSEAWWARWRRLFEWLIFKVFFHPNEENKK